MQATITTEAADMDQMSAEEPESPSQSGEDPSSTKPDAPIVAPDSQSSTADKDEEPVPGAAGTGAARAERPPKLPGWAKTSRAALALALVLILAGGLLANTAQTNGGTVRITQVSFPTSTGQMMTGLLYVPSTATVTTPACGVLTIEGYINTVDTMDGFSIEMARRGCVVLDANQTGQGTSTPPSFLDEFGGPDALAYLNSLPIVKKGDIGLIGHSMGGWASVLAAYSLPTGYRSVVLVSSSVSTPAVEPIPGTPTFPRNVAVVEAVDSEFSELMWAVPKGSEFPKSPRMQALFGTSQPIVVGHVYGSTAKGTGRVLYLENDMHPGMTFDPGAIEHSVSWMQTTLTGVSSLPASNQIWLWDEIGTFLGLVGVVLLLFGAGGELLRLPSFQSVARRRPENRSLRGFGWWAGALTLVLIGPVTFYWFQAYGQNQFKAGAIFPESITSGVATWAIGGALIALILLAAWQLSTRVRPREAFTSYGITEPEGPAIDWKNVGKSFLLALSAVAVLFIGVFFFEWAWTSDVRIWVFNIKPLDLTHLKATLSYIVPFLVYFLVLSTVLFGQIRPRVSSLPKFMGIVTALLVVGYVGLLAIEYGVLGATGELATSSQPLLTIVGFQFVPVFIIVGTVLSYFFWKTGRIYTGAFICAMLITSLLVTGTALQAAPW
ncbi:MAG: alpha/beta hydrolase family protein [Acidimicrobiales bacterium]